MAGIKIGSNDIKSVYIGGRMANSVYLGNTLLWTMFVPRVATFRTEASYYVFFNGDPSFLSKDSIGTPVNNGGMIFTIYTSTPVTLNVDFLTYRAGTVIPAGTRMSSTSFRSGTTIIFTEAQA